MINPENFFDTYDYSSVIEHIMKECGVMNDDNDYSRHMQEIDKKINDIKKNYKGKDYFMNMPILDNDYSSYVISKFYFNLNLF